MIPTGKLVLLDTTVLVELVRNRKVGQRIERDFSLTSRPERPLISIVSVGEALSLGDIWGWSSAKIERLRQMLNELVVLDLRQGDITTRYSAMTAYCKKHGHALSDNDRWIAATAAAAGAILLTTDKDFDPLHPAFVNRIWIDPA